MAPIENSAIAADREVALAALQPTPTELAHGLALHADACVVESYGFAGFAAPDADAIVEASTAGAAPDELARLRVESSMDLNNQIVPVTLARIAPNGDGYTVDPPAGAQASPRRVQLHVV